MADMPIVSGDVITYNSFIIEIYRRVATAA